MAITLDISAILAGVEEIASTDAPLSSAEGRTRRYNAANQTNIQLTGSTTPAVDTTPADLSGTLAGTTLDFDLTAVQTAKDNNVNVDLTGKKMIALLIVMAAANNAAGVTVKPQGANSYDLFGPANELVLFQGMAVLLTSLGTAAAGTPAVAAGEKDIRFEGTAADTWQAIAYFGT